MDTSPVVITTGRFVKHLTHSFLTACFLDFVVMVRLSGLQLVG